MHGAHGFPVKIPGSMDKRIHRALQEVVREFSSLAQERSMALYLPLNRIGSKTDVHTILLSNPQTLSRAEETGRAIRCIMEHCSN